MAINYTKYEPTLQLRYLVEAGIYERIFIKDSELITAYNNIMKQGLPLPDMVYFLVADSDNSGQQGFYRLQRKDLGENLELNDLFVAIVPQIEKIYKKVSTIATYVSIFTFLTIAGLVLYLIVACNAQ